MLSTPKFWLNNTGLSPVISGLLAPFSWLYLLGFFIKKKLTKTKSVALPVICIGNLNAGGAGKTPCALAIGKILHEMGIDFCYLTRGYGSEGEGVQFFEESQISQKNFQEVGDEAILLNEIAPIIIAKNRFLGASKIVAKAKFQAALLDDGLQNFSLKKDLSILVVDGQIGFGNGKILPAGPLRQSVKSGLEVVDLIVIVSGKKNDDLCKEITDARPDLANRIIFGKVKALNLEKFFGQKILAFCGLAYPSKFFSFLENQGLEVIKTVGFADHHFYKKYELIELQNSAKKLGAILLATKKDWVKFPPNLQEQIPYLDIALELENRALVVDLLKEKISISNNS